jgi:hypothetical protein
MRLHGLLLALMLTSASARADESPRPNRPPITTTAPQEIPDGAPAGGWYVGQSVVASATTEQSGAAIATRDGRWRLPVGVVASSLSAIALVGGIYTGASASSAYDRFQAQCVGSRCAAAAQEEYDRAKSLATTSTVLFTTAAVFAAVGLYMLLTLPTRAAPATSSTSSTSFRWTF